MYFTLYMYTKSCACAHCLEPTRSLGDLKITSLLAVLIIRWTTSPKSTLTVLSVRLSNFGDSVINSEYRTQQLATRIKPCGQARQFCLGNVPKAMFCDWKTSSVFNVRACVERHVLYMCEAGLHKRC